MPLHYWKGSLLTSGKNFGDLLNASLLEPRLDRRVLARHDVLGIGTILDNRFVKDRRGMIIFGSGIGHGALPENFHTFVPLLVRGPHTALEFGDVNLPQGDPGFLLSAETDSSASGGILIPHFTTNKKLPSRWLSLVTGLRFVDINQEPRAFVADVQGARYAYVEAMHGAIACEALRIPWAPIQLAAHEPWIKWMDALGPIGRRYTQPVSTRPSWTGKDVELFSRKHLMSRFPGGSMGEGTTLASDAQLGKVRRTIEHQIEKFNSESWLQ